MNHQPGENRFLRLEKLPGPEDRERTPKAPKKRTEGTVNPNFPNRPI